jgi:hypothetical protein
VTHIMNGCSVAVRHIKPRALPIATFRQRHQRIPFGDDSILSHPIPRYLSSTRKTGAKRCVESRAIYPSLPPRDDLFESHTPTVSSQLLHDAVYQGHDEYASTPKQVPGGRPATPPR